MNKIIYKNIANIFFYLFNFVVFIPLFRNFSIGNESLTNYLLLLLMFLFIFFAYLYDPRYFFTFKIKLFALFLTYFLLITVLTSNFDVFKRYYSIVYLLFYSFSLDYFIYHKIDLKVFTKPLFLLFPYFIIVSLYFLESFPFLIRNVNFDTPEYNLLRFYGVVGYDHIYALVLFIPALISSYKSLHNILSKLFSILIILLGTYLIIKAGFSLAILIFLPSLMIAPFFKIINKYLFLRLAFITFMISSISFFILFIFLNDAFYFDKINAFFQLILSGEIDGVLTGRLLTYSKSLFTFLNFPFTGAIFIPNLQIDDFNNPNVLIGLHSMVLDLAALFGIINLALLFYLLFSNQVKILKNYRKFATLLSLFGFITIITFNVDFPLLGFTYYFLIPSINREFLSDIFEKNQRNNVL